MGCSFFEMRGHSWNSATTLLGNLFLPLTPIDARTWPDPATWWPSTAVPWQTATRQIKLRFEIDSLAPDILEPDCTSIYELRTKDVFADCVLGGFLRTDHAISIFPGGKSRRQVQRLAAAIDQFAFIKDGDILSRHADWLLLHTVVAADRPALCWWSKVGNYNSIRLGLGRVFHEIF